MTTQTDIIRALAPELSGESNNRLSLFLNLASLSVNISVWGTKADYGTSLLAAHMMTVSKRNGVLGVSMETVGDLSRSYNAIKGDEIMMQTSYGAEYLRLKRSLIITPILV